MTVVLRCRSCGTDHSAPQPQCDSCGADGSKLGYLCTKHSPSGTSEWLASSECPRCLAEARRTSPAPSPSVPRRSVAARAVVPSPSPKAPAPVPEGTTESGRKETSWLAVIANGAGGATVGTMLFAAVRLSLSPLVNGALPLQADYGDLSRLSSTRVAATGMVALILGAAGYLSCRWWIKRRRGG
jgi:hypothetical protein